MIELIKTDLGRVLIAYPIAIMANNLLGAYKGRAKGNYSVDRLKLGLEKGLTLYTSIGLVVLIAHILPELSIDINGVDLTLVRGVYTLIYTAIGLLVIEIFIKIKDVINIKTGEIE